MSDLKKMCLLTWIVQLTIHRGYCYLSRNAHLYVKFSFFQFMQRRISHLTFIENNLERCASQVYAVNIILAPEIQVCLHRRKQL